MKETLEKRKSKLRSGFGWLIVFLVIELFIIGIVHHDFLEEKYNILLFGKIQSWLSEKFWPHPGQQEPHRLLIASLWEGLTSLKFYPLIALLVPKLIPAGLALNIVLQITNRLRGRAPRPTRSKKATTPDWLKHSGLSRFEQLRVWLRRMYLRHQAKFDDDLFLDPGIRVQYLSGSSNRLRKDQVHLWNADGKIIIDAGLNEARMFILDERGKAMMHTKSGFVPMEPGVPVPIRQNTDGESRIVVAFTWLGGF